ncbi:MAG TPA: DUF5668 domain-containing protein [Terriglobales bacterium]|jgi:predicted membrane protein|nr:DUF5668 domain-containing protein [Terriglobales bacterium]
MAGRNRGATSTLISGVVLTAIGVVFLLDRLDLVNASVLFRLWPLVFVAAGLTRIGPGSTGARVWGGFLISIGSLLTLHEFGYVHFGIGQLWPLFLIGAGLLLAWQANEVREGRKGALPPYGDNSALNSVCIFGGIERKMEGKYFQGGDVVAIFGGFKIDLSRADMEGNEAVINATALFGGGEIIVPETWRVLVEGTGIFGGYVDKTRHAPRADGAIKTLHVRGAAVFGGIEVKSW